MKKKISNSIKKKYLKALKDAFIKEIVREQNLMKDIDRKKKQDLFLNITMLNNYKAGVNKSLKDKKEITEEELMILCDKYHNFLNVYYTNCVRNIEEVDV